MVNTTVRYFIDSGTQNNTVLVRQRTLSSLLLTLYGFVKYVPGVGRNGSKMYHNDVKLNVFTIN